MGYGKIKLSGVNVTLARNKYSLSKVFEIFESKIDKRVSEYLIDKLGVDRVFKAYDLEHLDKQPQTLLEMYTESGKCTLNSIGRGAPSLGMIITVNDSSDDMVPSPATRLVSSLHESMYTRTQNLQGMACSASTEAMLSAAANASFSEDRKGALIAIGSYYTNLFVSNISSMKKITIDDRNAVNLLAYFSMFSDAVVSAYASPVGADTGGDYSVVFDLDSIRAFRDNRPEASENYYVKLTSRPEGVSFPMFVDSKDLMESRAGMVKMGVSDLMENRKEDFRNIVAVAEHTAGKRFMRRVEEVAKIQPSLTVASHEMLARTGNTGPASILQVIDYMYDKKFMNKGDVGMTADFGWDSAAVGLFEIV